MLTGYALANGALRDCFPSPKGLAASQSTGADLALANYESQQRMSNLQQMALNQAQLASFQFTFASRFSNTSDDAPHDNPTIQRLSEAYRLLDIS
jgi:hypothetical protein